MYNLRVIVRAQHERRIEELLRTFGVVAILGARQVGKTTLAGLIAEGWSGPTSYIDLERPADLARLDEAELTLERLDGLVIIDEIQRRPDLFGVLRGLVDRYPDRRYLILGSAAPELLRQSSETLAGRIAYHPLPPFTLHEVGSDQLDRLWIRGGFPRSYLADSQRASFDWRFNFIRTFVERDLPSLGTRIPGPVFDRFWRMLANSHGGVWNGSRFGSSFGVSDTTVRRYLDFLSAALVVLQLQPWHENVAKRQVRSPKVYVADSGLLHALLDLEDQTAVERHPVLGPSWEGFIINQIIALTGARDDQIYFWATHGGAELDLLIVRGNERVGFEIKRTTSPRITRSIRSAIETLHLDATYVVHAGHESFPLADGIEAISAHRLIETLG